VTTIPIRIRLTLWYVVMLALMLVTFAAAVYEFIEYEERRNIDGVLRERAAVFAREYANEATEGSSKSAFAEAARTAGGGSGDVFIYDTTLQLIARSPAHLLAGNAVSIPRVRTAIRSALKGSPQTVSVNEVRFIAAPIDRGFVFVGTESLAGRREALRRVRAAFALAIPAALLIAAIGGYVLALRSLAPVARITEIASRIEADNLSERILSGHDDELGRLAAVLNALLERLERSFQQQKQLLADTSHELRTPLAIIRGEAEVTLSRQRSQDEYRHALEIVRSEAAHLTNLIESVLILARADARQLRLARDRFSLGDVIDGSVEIFTTLARAQRVDLSRGTDGAMPMCGDAELIRRMLLNLIDNAIKFTPAGGRVRVDAHRDGPNYVITVADTGTGIAVEDQRKIFDRFFRADRTRARDADRDSASGAGLGLAIVKWIAQAHGGEVRLVRSGASGSVFEVMLPGSDA
jgi:heavy metal sensor kinase